MNNMCLINETWINYRLFVPSFFNFSFRNYTKSNIMEMFEGKFVEQKLFKNFFLPEEGGISPFRGGIIEFSRVSRCWTNMAARVSMVTPSAIRYNPWWNARTGNTRGGTKRGWNYSGGCARDDEGKPFIFQRRPWKKKKKENLCLSIYRETMRAVKNN